MRNQEEASTNSLKKLERVSIGWIEFVPGRYRDWIGEGRVVP